MSDIEKDNIEDKNFDLNDDIETAEEAQFRLERAKWYYRRGIAIKAFNAVLVTLAVVIGLFLFKKDMSNFAIIENVVITIVLGLVSIVGFYFGTATWADLKNPKQ